MEATLRTINAVISLLFLICYAYQFCYIPVSLFCRKQTGSSEAPMQRYAVLIAARNEEAVIGDLLHSIQRQNYDSTRITVFVLADNCTDRTAQTAHRLGAVVYERYDPKHIGKGYALDALLRHIRQDFPEGFDGYFVFDADNLLDPNYIREMNRLFSQGYSVLTSYRNSKNYNSNWISAGYALWFLRESRYLNGARMALRSSCAVSGTGFLFSREIMEEMNGWPFHLLTEDIEFSVCQILHGRRIGFCASAVLYDEQPVSFRQSCRQRLRWAKGYMQVFQKYGLPLLRGIFRGSWACFDMSMAIMPAFILSFASVVLNAALAVCGLISGIGVWFAIRSLLECLGSMYLMLFLVGLVTLISEWRQIHADVPRKLLSVFTFPIFMFTYIPVSLAALFIRVEWKPISHSIHRNALVPFK